MISYPLASCVFLVGVFDFNRAPAFYPGPAVFQFGCDIFLKVAIEFPLGRDCSFKRELLFWRSRNGLAYLRCWRMRFAEGDHQTNSEEYRSRHHDRFAASHGSCFFLNGVVGFKKLKSPIRVSYLAITGGENELVLVPLKLSKLPTEDTALTAFVSANQHNGCSNTWKFVIALWL